MSDLTIYLIVRKDLKMSTGKIAAQCGHAVEDLIYNCQKPIMHSYRRNGSPKIVCQAKNLAELQELETFCIRERMKYHSVIDAGKTEVSPDTFTVLGVGPIAKNPVLRNLKLF